ncbi:MAG TPA: hypothetical protein VJQ08_10535 [Candidatus Dormibacteraeota bacterium]|nr:hypothetical protein [Candidatus Dormibacteraeota bacterium]
MSRVLGIGLAALLAIGVLAAIVISYTQTHGSPGSKVVAVHGVIGSEKQPFFQDSAVIAEFRAQGYDVQVDTAGSRQIATTVDLSKYDFAFPAGEPAAVKIQKDHHAKATYIPFYTPMAIATFTTIVDLLKTAGVVTTSNGVQMLDMRGFLALVAQNKRWTDIPNNSTYPAGKSIVITSTDPTTSNSAAMYLSIASYVANGNNVVQDQSQASRVLPAVSPLFTRQGFTLSSTEAPFEDYLSIGIGKDPMVMIYEAQYVAREAAKDGSIKSDKALLYPSPTVFSKHTLVPLTNNGDAVGRLLRDDAKLQSLAVKYGFRTSDSAAFNKYLTDRGVTPPPPPVNVIDPPTYDNLEALINGIAALQSQVKAGG